MPYIDQRRRRQLDEIHRSAVWHDSVPKTVGELNYVITRQVMSFLGKSENLADVLSYADITYSDLNEVVGVLECVKQELYRRVAAPYEDRKCAENGDVYR